MFSQIDIDKFIEVLEGKINRKLTREERILIGSTAFEFFQQGMGYVIDKWEKTVDEHFKGEQSDDANKYL